MLMSLFVVVHRVFVLSMFILLMFFPTVLTLEFSFPSYTPQRGTWGHIVILDLKPDMSANMHVWRDFARTLRRSRELPQSEATLLKACDVEGLSPLLAECKQRVHSSNSATGHYVLCRQR